MKNSITFCLLLIAISICAQDTIEKNSVYKMRLGIDIPIGVISLGTGVAGITLWAKKSPLTQVDINQFSILDVNQFDRYATYQHSKASAIVSDVFLYSAAASPALLFIDKDIRKDWKTILPIWAETFVFTAALTMFTKEIIHRNRPYLYTHFKNGDKFSKDANASFWSGHTAIVASSTFFIAMIYNDYHPHSKWKPLIWTGAAVLPALTAVARVEAGKHFWTDVITAYVVGALAGSLTPLVHRRILNNKRKRSRLQNIQF